MRSINQVIQPHVVIEGAGVRLRRSFGPSRENPLDPFLLFDHFAFNDPIEGPIMGFPTHPHRGIETVTYMLEGNVRHRDSLNNMGVIGPGDVQWMTSGRGILHEEMPRRGPSGNVFGFQLWVNLPAAQKMSSPRYQEVKAADIPVIDSHGVRVRVVAGEFRGTRGPVQEIAAKPVYLDVTMDPDAEFGIAVPTGHTLIAYLFEGGVRATPEADPVDAIAMIAFGKGDRIQITSDAKMGARFMLIAGAPFGEPIVPYGPFVMNSEQEIRQALADLRAGTFVQRHNSPA